MPATTPARTGRTQPCPDPPRPTPTQLRRASLDLDAVLTSPRRARAWPREMLWELGDLTDTAVIAHQGGCSTRANQGRSS